MTRIPASAGFETVPRILVAGIGNIFLGDDGFGSEVARRMLERPAPEGVRIVDFGIRGVDLAYALADRPEVTILVDAMARGAPAGELTLVEPTCDPLENAGGSPGFNGHTLHPLEVLRLVRSWGVELRRILLVACEPEDLGETTDGRWGLSERVEAATARAVPLIEELIQTLLTSPADQSGTALATETMSEFPLQFDRNRQSDEH